MKPLSAFLLPALLAACADPGQFPSLARRPFEKAGPPLPGPAPAPPERASDPALLGRISAALARARGSVPAFDAAALPARTEMERAALAPRESEAWVEAQLMVTRLETKTAPVREALADLDGERRALEQLPGSPDYPMLLIAIAELEAIDARQSQIVRDLLSRLK